MRITNTMMANTMMRNINRNMIYSDKLYNQIASTKKIQAPSDDPIIASRSLKFRTSVSETVQYQRNVQSGLAWMEVTESSFTNMVENLIAQIRVRCVEAATGTETQEDKAAIVAEIRELIEQIGLEMNQSYAGRYVFSGFRTDQPPVLVEDNNNAYIITQVFDLHDIEKTKSYQKLDETEVATVKDINVLKLASKDADFNFVGYYPDGTRADLGKLGVFKPDGTAYNVEIKKSTDPDAYLPPDDGNTIYHIVDTGEMVMGNTAASQFQDGTKITYEKHNIKKGELNPLVYFDCVEMTGFVPSTTVPEGGGFTYLSTSPLNSAQFHGVLAQSSYTQANQQVFNFTINHTDGTTENVSIGNIDYGLYMQDYYAANYAGKRNANNDKDYPSNIDDFIKDMYNADYSINNGYDTVFYDVLEAAYNQVFADKGVDGQLKATVSVDSGTGLVKVRFAAVGDEKATIMYATGCSPGTGYGHDLYHSNLFVGTSGDSAAIIPEPIFEKAVAYDMNNQEMQYEFSANTTVTINALAKNVYTDKMYADLLQLADFVESLNISDEKAVEKMYQEAPYHLTGEDLANAVQKHMSDETALAQSVIYYRFNNMLNRIDRHAAQAMREQTQLGGRMNRLGLLQTRLEQDETNFTKLLSDNEDTDYAKTYTNYSMAEAAYEASLKAGSNIVKLTLANFI